MNDISHILTGGHCEKTEQAPLKVDILCLRVAVISLSALLCLPILTNAQNHPYEHDQFIKSTDTLSYLMLWPVNFNKSKKYPLVLFLHGAGERGDDNKKQLVHGSNLFLYTRAEYPAIVLFPQCPRGDYWSNVNIVNADSKRGHVFQNGGEPTVSMALLMGLMDSVIQLPFVNQERSYVAGLSMGGMGTFELLNRRPDMFAAAVSICGGGHPKMTKAFAGKVDLWVFHGAKDNVVLPEHSKKMVDAIRQYGGEVKFTLYPKANHNSWDLAFAEPGLLKWLFSQSK